MRITEVIPLVLGAKWRNLTHVLVRTDDGIEGVGEVRMINHTDALLGYLTEAVPNYVLGADPSEIEALVQRMRGCDPSSTPRRAWRRRGGSTVPRERQSCLSTTIASPRW